MAAQAVGTHSSKHPPRTHSPQLIYLDSQKETLPLNGNPLVLCLSYINCSVICLKALSERNIYTTTTISASENKNSLRAEKEQLKGDMFCA